MSNWNWKWECCLVFGGLMVGGPLGTLLLRILQRSVQSPRHEYSFLSDDSGNSAVSLLVPSSLWFVVTTSCVGVFFWLLGEVLRKLHSATATATSATTTRSMDATRERGRIEARRGGERERGIEGEGGGLGQDQIFQIHHFAGELIFFPFLPHGRIRLWGTSFL